MNPLSSIQPSTEHAPLPWQIGITLYPYRHFYGPADKDGFCPAIGSCVTALGEEYDVANATFIVEAVNSHAALKSRIEQLEGALQAIMTATVEGRVCDDVAWFDGITTLHDFCDIVLNGPDAEQEIPK